VASARLGNAGLRPDHGYYSLGLDLDLPWERTSERNAYRNSLLALELAARGVQELEDEIKLDVREGLRALAQARESTRIQAQGVVLATRRVKNTNLLLQAGRAKVRDVLFAQESLLSVQNGLTAALRNYRVAELALQRDMGVLEITDTGLWREYRPDERK
jgi:outer membrane protein TolC